MIAFLRNLFPEKLNFSAEFAFHFGHKLKIKMASDAQNDRNCQNI